ncbi:sulfite oxidase [Devosia nitrariae]|uniref:Sulfite oxidase n=1 Tax=Devosia nitrariae TaxID=2071872 RepID=A0ABQ5W4Z4_9HYPH|nr:sulfite oxidase [Devosia nitrariae]GLQ54854.1 hypothetical protein GCM10010862_21130 [Devosia nitrariae]
MQDIPRREFIVKGSAVLAGLAAFQLASRAYGFPSRPGEEVVPWSDTLPPNPVPEVIKNQLVWSDLDSWITPNEQFFSIAHFDRPVIDPATWSLDITGLVGRPMTLSLDDIKQRPRQEVVFTVECSGNDGLPFFNGGIGNATWAGTPLAPILEEAGILEDGIEVVFWGADQGDVSIRDITFKQNFARSMSLADAMNPNNILCYEMNGEPLPADNGAPLRLIAPGWYGIANIKWLNRMEVLDRRFQGLFMARDYVTLREEQRDGETVWMETSVGPALLKSAPARITRVGTDYRILGAAWGAPIERVEVRVDDGDWIEAVIDDSEEAEFAWKIWSLDWPDPASGSHAVTSRAIDTSGNIQPAMDDPLMTKKVTFWETNGQVTRNVVIG